MPLLKHIGKFSVQKNRISIDFSSGDIVRYYMWHIKKATWNTINLSTPRYGAHVSVILPHIHESKIHGKDLTKVFSRWHKMETELWIDPTDIREGGKSKGFINFWTPVFCKDIDRIHDILKIPKTEKNRPHLTICSNKFEKNDKKV